MPRIIELTPKGGPELGYLTVIEKVLPFEVKRVYYIYQAKGVRGGHRHKKTVQALVCVAGQCKIHCNNGKTKEDVWLDNPNRLLILEPEDWHTMSEFSADAVLLVLASELYDRADYIDEEYP